MMGESCSLWRRKRRRMIEGLHETPVHSWVKSGIQRRRRVREVEERVWRKDGKIVGWDSVGVGYVHWWWRPAYMGRH